MKHKINCRWLENMAFEAEVNNHHFLLDADEAAGGQNKGPRPKALTLVSLAGCTGMDVIAILKKMQVFPEFFNVSVEGELTEEHPKFYHKIHVIYEIKGNDIPLEKVEKAVNLSREKYCGVYALLNHGTEMTYKIKFV